LTFRFYPVNSWVCSAHGSAGPDGRRARGGFAMDWGLVILCLIMVESGGNNAAVGDSGRALGCLQIHAGVVYDVNRIYGTSFKHEDAKDRQKSVQICQLYLRHYCHDYERRTKKPATPEIAARIWNGGPIGFRKSATDKYWALVKEAMAAQKKG